jgi:hypothetical protein
MVFSNYLFSPLGQTSRRVSEKKRAGEKKGEQNHQARNIKMGGFYRFPHWVAARHFEGFGS